MPETLAQVTRRYSQRINRLNRWREGRLVRIESERQAALSSTPEAVAVLAAFDERVARAEQHHAQTIASARRANADTRGRSIAARAALLASLAERYAEDQQQARETREEVERRAREAYDNEVDRARSRGIDESYLRAVEAARKKRDRAINAALRTFDKRGRQDRDAYTRAVERASTEQSRELIAADMELADAINSADGALIEELREAGKDRDTALDALAAIAEVERDYKRRLRELRKDFRERQAAIAEQLREEIAALA